jgi:hypothetical protein
MMDIEILRERAYGDLEHAFEYFTDRNRGATHVALQKDEMALSVLSRYFPLLYQDYIDPMLYSAADCNVRRCLPRTRINVMLQRMLAHAREGKNAITAEPKDLEAAADRLRRSVSAAVSYLARHGVNHDELVPSAPLTFEVLVALFDRFQHAEVDKFALHWMVCVMGATDQDIDRKNLVKRAQRAINTGASYTEVRAELAALLPPGPLRDFSEVQLHLLPRKGGPRNWGKPGFLYTIASSTAVAGPVHDLAAPDTVFPQPGMHLRPLCENAPFGMLVCHAWMSDRTAEVINAHRGWTRGAYDELQPTNAVRRAHQLPLPPKDLPPEQISEWLIKERSPLITHTLNELFAHVATLRDSPMP